MKRAAASPRRTPATPGREGTLGATLLELAAAMSLGGLAAVAVLAGLRPLTDAARANAARAVLVEAMIEARRLAYRSEEPAAVSVPIGAVAVRILPSGRRFELGRGVTVVAAPSDEAVEFRASGLADNATVTVAAGRSTASVVVNQRGIVR